MLLQLNWPSSQYLTLRELLTWPSQRLLVDHTLHPRDPVSPRSSFRNLEALFGSCNRYVQAFPLFAAKFSILFVSTEIGQTFLMNDLNYKLLRKIRLK